MTMTLSRLASNIHHLRKQLLLSQEELGNSLGLNRGNIASYEKGTAEPKICNLINLANFYKVSVIDLVTTDLRCPIALQSAKANYRYELKKEDKAILNKFIEEAEELKIVLDSLKICHRFQVKTAQKIPTELQPIVSNFNQLCNAGSHLMKAHIDLLDFVKSRMK